MYSVFWGGLLIGGRMVGALNMVVKCTVRWTPRVSLKAYIMSDLGMASVLCVGRKVRSPLSPVQEEIVRAY